MWVLMQIATTTWATVQAIVYAVLTLIRKGERG
jgi:hypothetical protein